MTSKELLKQVAITTAAVAIGTVTVTVVRDKWDVWFPKSGTPSAPLPSPGAPQRPPEKQLPQGGSLENSPCAAQTKTFLDCAYKNSDNVIACAALAEQLKSCRKMFKLEPEGESWWK